MNLSELIKQHDEASEQLIRAIEVDDNALVEQFDKKLSEALADIIALKVEDAGLLYLKINFLLGQVLPHHQRTETSERLCEQILQEIAQYTNHQEEK